MAEVSSGLKGEARQDDRWGQSRPNAADQRYQLLLEITELVVRVRDVPDLFKELAPRVLALTDCEFLNFSLHDPRQNCTLTHYWKKNQESGEFDAFAADECVSGRVWKQQEAISIPDTRLERRFPMCIAVLHKHGVRSYTMLPMSTASNRFGALGLGKNVPEVLPAEGAEFLSRVAQMVALALENTLTHETLQREKERLQTLSEVGAALLGSKLELRDLFPQIDGCIGKIVAHDVAVIALLDEKAGCVRTYALEPGLLPEIWCPGKTYPMSQTLASEIQAGEARILGLQDLEALSARVPHLRAVLQAGFQSECAVSLATAKGRLGVLYLLSKQANAFREQDLELLKPVAAEVALVVENAVTHQALNAEKERLQMLLEISTTLVSNLDLEELFPAIAGAVRKVVRHDYASVCVYDEAVQGLRFHGLDPRPNASTLPATILPLDDSLAGRAFRDREARIYNRADLEETGLTLVQQLMDLGIQSVCCVPLLTRTSAIGALTLGSREDSAFLPRDMDLLTQVAAQVAIALDNARAYREIAQLKDRLAREKRYLENEIHREMQWDEIVGNSAALKRVLDHAFIVANTDSTVLITGETGTGKEQVARAIHAMSRRSDRTFIKLNCAAIPTGLLESELFGHERGAFTGAVSQKIGRLELADKGTLFLDEIGEVPLEMQPKLLRVLQDQEFERLGGTRTIRVDARLIAATNRDLIRAVEEKAFRSDLFYRLHVFPLHLPALRERREDIPVLVRHFVEKCAARLNRRIEIIPDEAIEAMLKWSWPGNIRELENFIERSVILSEGQTLRAPLAELRQEISRQQHHESGTLRDRERDHIIEILRQTRGVLSGQGGAAARLGLKRTTLQYKLQKLGIARVEYLE